MGAIGAGTGAAVGGVFLGPLGAVAGSVLGSFLEDVFDDPVVEEPDSDQLPMRLSFEDGPDGRLLVLWPEFPVENINRFGVSFRDSVTGKRLKSSVCELSDDDGKFFHVVPSFGASSPCFIPWGAIKYDSDHGVEVFISAWDEEDPLGYSVFELPWRKRKREYSVASHWRPAIAMARLVAQADSTTTLGAAANYVRDAIGVPPADPQFSAVWSEAAAADLDEEISEWMERFSWTNWEELFDVMVGVARLEETPGRNRLNLLRRIAIALVVDDFEWSRFADFKGIADMGSQRQSGAGSASEADPVLNAYRVLNLKPGASVSEVRSAHRAAIKEYHPDKVATLATEFQDLAKRKSQEINEAARTLYQALREAP